MIVAALKEFGTIEAPGDADNKKIIGWQAELEAAGLGRVYAGVYRHDAIPWCGLFMAIVALRANRERRPERNPPRLYLSALQWASFGTATPKGAAALGDVLVFKRKGGSNRRRRASPLQVGLASEQNQGSVSADRAGRHRSKDQHSPEMVDRAGYFALDRRDGPDENRATAGSAHPTSGFEAVGTFARRPPPEVVDHLFRARRQDVDRKAAPIEDVGERRGSSIHRDHHGGRLRAHMGRGEPEKAGRPGPALHRDHNRAGRPGAHERPEPLGINVRHSLSPLSDVATSTGPTDQKPRA